MDSEGTHEDQHHVSLPEAGTGALGEFVKTYNALMLFIGFTSSLVLSADHVRRVAREALAESLDEGTRDEFKDAEDDLVRREFQRHRQTLLEMTLARAVDNYLTYLSELLATLYRERPEMLMSGKQVRIDFVLEHASMADLIQSIAERTVDDVAYLSLGELASYFDRHGLTLFPHEEALTRAVRIVESRNLIVHNRGVVNQRFVSRVGSGVVGEALELTVDTVFEDVEFIAASVFKTDTDAIAHFSLPRVPIQPGPLVG